MNTDVMKKEKKSPKYPNAIDVLRNEDSDGTQQQCRHHSNHNTTTLRRHPRGAIGIRTRAGARARARRGGAGSSGSSARLGRRACRGGGCDGNEVFHRAPGRAGIGRRVGVRNVVDSTGRGKLDDGSVGRKVGGTRVLGGRSSHGNGGVGNNVNNVGSRAIVGDVGESELDTFISRQKDGSGLTVLCRKVTVRLSCRLEPREMNNKDLSASSSYTRGIQEVNMVIRQSHHWLVASSVEASCFDVGPSNSRRLRCSGEVCKTEEPKFTSDIKHVEDVCIMIEDSGIAHVGTASGSLGSPRFCGRIEEMNVGGVFRVSVQYVYSIVELREVASSVCAIKWWST